MHQCFSHLLLNLKPCTPFLKTFHTFKDSTLILNHLSYLLKMQALAQERLDNLMML
jgi:hypothetical protein